MAFVVFADVVETSLLDFILILVDIFYFMLQLKLELHNIYVVFFVEFCLIKRLEEFIKN